RQRPGPPAQDRQPQTSHTCENRASHKSLQVSLVMVSLVLVIAPLRQFHPPARSSVLGPLPTNRAADASPLRSRARLRGLEPARSVSPRGPLTTATARPRLRPCCPYQGSRPHEGSRPLQGSRPPQGRARSRPTD